MLKLRPEERLLLYCTRSYFDAQLADEVHGLAHEAIDWPQILELSQKHGVLPLVYKSLSSFAPKAVPEDILAELRRQVQVSIGFNIYMTKTLCQLLKLFEERDIPTIPFKGPTLAVTAYGDLNLRPFSDLDLWVSRRNYSKAKDVLASRGYRPSPDLDLPWECHFTDEHGKVNIDLHQAITPTEIPFPLAFEDLWKRLEPIPLAGTTLRAPSPEDLLIILCVQLVKDLWSVHAGVGNETSSYVRLIKICDIAKLLRRHPPADWSRLINHARALRSERMLLFALWHVHTLLGVGLPREIVTKARDNPLTRAFFAPVEDWLFDRVKRTFGEVEQLHFQLEVRERLWDRMSLVLAPTEQDEKALRLPSSLYFLYYLIRPIRLVGEFGVKSVKYYRRRRDLQ
jgi:hypothetical protein